MLLTDLTTSDPVFEAIIFPVLQAFGYVSLTACADGMYSKLYCFFFFNCMLFTYRFVLSFWSCSKLYWLSAFHFIFAVLLCSSTYLLLKPSRAPGFAYSWLELVSHRIFITKLLLQTPQKKVTMRFMVLENMKTVTSCFLLVQGWPMFQQLLISLFKFLAPFLRNAELSKPTHLLYKVNSRWKRI